MSKLDIKHMRLKKQSFDGIYRGVVENNNDPEKLGRVQVRIVGIHTSDKKDSTLGISTDMLPWAEPCQGLTEGSMSGYGLFSVPLNGSHVFLFFEGSNWECPRYFATAGGKPEQSPDPSKGFNDPDGVYPNKVGESDVNRLARNENTSDTILQTKSSNRVTGIPTAIGGSWDEPVSPYNTEYPHNIVLSTHSDITIELDSSPNSRRIHIYHPSGTYLEIDDTGNLVIRNDGDKFDIIKAKYYRTSDESNTHTVGASTDIVGGDKTEKITGFVESTVSGTKKITVSGIFDIVSTTTRISGHLEVGSGDTGAFTSGSGQTITVNNGIITKIT